MNDTQAPAGTRFDRTIEVDGTTVHYLDHEGPAETDRLPTILIHGTGGTAQSHFGFVAPMLATRGRVIALDLGEPTGAGLDLDDLVAQVDAVRRDALGEAAVTVLGYSLGAVIAAALAGRRSDVVTQLILVAGWIRTDAQQRLRNEVWTRLADEAPEALGAYSTFCAFGDQYLHARSDEAVAQLHQNAAPSRFLRKQMQLNRDIDIAADVERIRARTLVVGLGSDRMVPAHHSRELFGAIEDARYAELPTGHAVVFERPAQLFALVDEFTGHPDRYPAAAIIAPPAP